MQINISYKVGLRFVSAAYLINNKQKTAEMRKEMKKKFVTMMTVVLSACCLFGCGNTESGQEVTSSSEQQSTVENTQDKSEGTDEKETNTDEKETNNDLNKIADGTYNIKVESSSSMFKVEKAELIVAGEKMTAVITLSGTGYGKLYIGTAENAKNANEADYVTYVEDSNGAYTFTIPVAALDQPIDCAAFSNKKEEWYDRQLTFLSESIGNEAGGNEQTTDNTTEDTSNGNASAEVADGTYSIEVILGGGSGKSTVLSPATITVADGKMIARIEWSSSNYDYMLVDGTKYLPVNTEGNSVFEIPVAELDVELDVIGDTVAMSKPREIEYTLKFNSNSMKAAE